jgi:hypothetical protein
MQRGTIDAVQSDDDSMASPTEVTVFGGYFPFASRYSLDVPVLFNQYGLKEIWEAEYAKVGVKHISAGARDPCHFATKDPINSLADLEGQARLHLPDRRPLPDAVRRGAGDAALGRHRGRRADRRTRRHRLVGHHRGLHRRLGRRDQLLPDQQHLRRLDRLVLRQQERWNELPDHLKQLLMVCMEAVATTTASGGTGAAKPTARQRHQDAADLHSGRGMGRSKTPPRCSGTRSPPKARPRRRSWRSSSEYNADMQKAGRPYRQS